LAQNKKISARLGAPRVLDLRICQFQMPSSISSC